MGWDAPARGVIITPLTPLTPRIPPNYSHGEPILIETFVTLKGKIDARPVLHESKSDSAETEIRMSRMMRAALDMRLCDLWPGLWAPPFESYWACCGGDHEAGTAAMGDMATGGGHGGGHEAATVAATGSGHGNRSHERRPWLRPRGGHGRRPAAAMEKLPLAAMVAATRQKNAHSRDKSFIKNGLSRKSPTPPLDS